MSHHTGTGQSVDFFVVRSGVSLTCAADASDFAHATIFNSSDPHKGLGGFGVVALDDVVVDGAFARMRLTYPSPHLLRRQYTPRPYANMSTRWTKDPNILAVTKFTRQEVDKMVNGFAGDFKGFQGYLEGTDVSLLPLSTRN